MRDGERGHSFEHSHDPPHWKACGLGPRLIRHGGRLVSRGETTADASQTFLKPDCKAAPSRRRRGDRISIVYVESTPPLAHSRWDGYKVSALVEC